MRIVLLIFMGLTIIGCKKKSAPIPPDAALLVFPEKNSECTTGLSLSATTSQVEFKWSAADNVETYELRVTNINKNVTQTISTGATSAKLTIDKGDPFSWLVNSKNSQSNQISTSETWRFYNSGFETSHPPFPPEINSPKLAESVFKDVNNEITLDWTGVDVDNDIVSYDVYFSVESSPVTIISSPSASVTAQKVSVSSNTIYYWRIVAKDSNGNSADSGIFNFKVL